MPPCRARLVLAGCDSAVTYSDPEYGRKYYQAHKDRIHAAHRARRARKAARGAPEAYRPPVCYLCAAPAEPGRPCAQPLRLSICAADVCNEIDQWWRVGGRHGLRKVPRDPRLVGIAIAAFYLAHISRVD